MDGAEVGVEGSQLFPGGSVPQPQGRVERAAGQQAFAVGRYGDGRADTAPAVVLGVRLVAGQAQLFDADLVFDNGNDGLGTAACFATRSLRSQGTQPKMAPNSSK